MSVPTDVPARSADDFGVITMRGPDAAKFLQGQVSADVEKLAPGARTLAGLHNPQGRVIALLDIARTGDDEFLATLPRDLVAAVTQRLRKFVLRAQVRIEETAGTVVSGRETASAFSPPDTTLQPIDAVRAGQPQVYAATSEQFVAQMLNLDLIGAIAFDKGCYTGQEVIARAHYRGRVKRRMQRWRNAGGTRLQPGDAARARDGRPLIVVRVADDGEGGQQLLAVGNYGALNDVETPASEAVIVDGPLPLPYTLPE